MAREAGFDFYDSMHVWTTPTKDVPYPEGVYTENLERFAALVAAAERERICQLLGVLPITNSDLKLIRDVIRGEGEK